MENFNRRVDQMRRTSVIVPNLKRFNYHHLPPTVEIKEESEESCSDEYDSIKIRPLKKPCTSNSWSSSSSSSVNNYNPFSYDRLHHCLAGEDEVEIYCKKCTREFSSLQSYLIHLYHPPSLLHYPKPTLHLFSDTCNTNINEKNTTTATTSTTTNTSRTTKKTNRKQKRMKSILKEKNNNNQQQQSLLPQIPEKSISSEPCHHVEEIKEWYKNEAVAVVVKDTTSIKLEEEEEMEMEIEYSPIITNPEENDENNNNNNNTITTVALFGSIIVSPKKEKSSTKCPDCDQILKNENGLKAHRVMIETTKCPAPTCPLTFDLRCLFKKHVMTCPALPSDTKKSHRSKYYLNANIKKIEPDLSFLCPYNDCRAKISTQIELDEHVQRHVEERSHMCEHCGMGFYTRGALSRHVAHIHSNERPFKCDLCGAGFKGSGTLAKHKSIHMNVRKHHCIECGRGFKTTDALNVHLRLHSDIRMFNCEICNNIGFNHKVTLKRHYAKYHMQYHVKFNE